VTPAGRRCRWCCDPATATAGLCTRHEETEALRLRVADVHRCLAGPVLEEERDRLGALLVRLEARRAVRTGDLDEWRRLFVVPRRTRSLPVTDVAAAALVRRRERDRARYRRLMLDPEARERRRRREREYKAERRAHPV
jgi:hypothetical protein